ncbi:MAG: outer membrane protein assembly factor [bacterium]
MNARVSFRLVLIAARCVIVCAAAAIASDARAVGAGADSAFVAANDSAGAWPTVVAVRIETESRDAQGWLESEWKSLAGARAIPSDVARVADRTLDRLAAEGRLESACRISLHPAADSVASHAELRVVYDIREPVALRGAEVSGARAISPDEARRLLGITDGEVFSSARFQRGAGELLEKYEQAGFPFARVTPRDFAADPEMRLRVIVDEGASASVTGLIAQGNDGTRTSFIAREMLLRIGEAWNPRALERGRARLLRTGLFRAVAPPYPLVEEDGAGVRVGLVVEEAPANRIEGVFGFNQGEGTEESFFSGYLDLLLKNLGGVGRRAAVRWERRAQDARELRFGYREPWLPFVPLAAEFDLRRTFRDSTYARTEVAGGLEMPVSPALSLTASLARDSWSPGEREPATVPRSRRTRGGAGFRWSATDDPVNTSRGFNLEVAADYASKRIDPIAVAADSSASPSAETPAAIDVGEWIGRASVELFLPISGPHLVRLAASGSAIASDEEIVPEYEQFFLGGARSLRGYDEDRFLGEKVGVVSAEYRYRLGGRSRVFLFVDQGYVTFERVSAAGGVAREEATPLGWGAGLQTDSRLGVMGVGVGVPEAEGLSSARVHVSVAQEF